MTCNEEGPRGSSAPGLTCTLCRPPSEAAAGTPATTAQADRNTPHFTPAADPSPQAPSQWRAHADQQLGVAAQCGVVRGEGNVGHVLLLADAADDLGHFWVVDVVDGLEEVMLDLVIDATKQHRDRDVVHAPIRGATQLVLAPTNLRGGSMHILGLVVRVRDVVDHNEAKSEHETLGEQLPHAKPPGQSPGEQVAQRDLKGRKKAFPLDKCHDVGHRVDEPDVTVLVSEPPKVRVLIMQSEEGHPAVSVQI
eukprot:CAMPEP_0177225048 /NCGR_PEP_ID=MMETSP0367-20130122/39344_1 /TAXON_ID=447022 ORGANISM="Scrippsiella hangoei-like, Strain SHHI-4" /NCGR_SAMPLE_ID=MMETSP0367 /ASSEMBLY_ACC=CAM_ASM_000362 /LENGTH=250 /DNA_ID=CAMNT_0018675127 /DNA_START=157 /DNA_END=911 /DNA_ORIENTATION=-